MFQGDLPLATAIAVFNINGNARVGILPLGVELLAAAMPASMTKSTLPEATLMPATILKVTTTKQALKEIAECFGVGFCVAAAAEFKPLIPIRRRLEVFATVPAFAELIVSRALFRVLQYFVGFIDFLETLFRIGLFAHIRVKFTREFSIGFFDVTLRGGAFDAEDLIVVAVLHAKSTAPINTVSRKRKRHPKVPFRSSVNVTL